MESNNIELKNSLKRHFYFPSIELDNLPKKSEWRWSNNCTLYTNVDRESFPVLNKLESGDFLDLRIAINNYEDVVYANRDYLKAEETRKIYCSHLIDHLFKVRSTMKKNNDKISERGDKISGIRDQGFHRCRAMIIVPTRHSALQIVNCLRSLMPEHKIKKNWKDFVKEYTEEIEDEDISEKEEEDSEDDNEQNDTARKQGLIDKINTNLKLSKLKHTVHKIGIDFDEWKLGNTNENFVLGVSVDKKLFQVKTKFLNSDIIIGSPLALRQIIADKKNYVNQLAITSSIEILIMDQVEYLMVQNFDNIYSILEKLNQMPRGSGDVIKVMNSTLRVYKWALSNQGNIFRQNIIISATLHPFIKKIMSFCHNFQGINIFLPKPNLGKTLLMQVANKIQIKPAAKKQKLNGNILFEKLDFSCPIPEECVNFEVTSTDIFVDIKPCDSRLGLFKRKIVSLLINKFNQGGVLMYFTQTIDLYKVHKILQTENLNVCVVSEDVPENEIEKSISLFAKRRIKYLLLSERYYALTRKRFSAVQHLIYFSVPTFPKFAKDFHDFMTFRSKATEEFPHHVFSLCENELFEQINSKLAFNVIYEE